MRTPGAPVWLETVRAMGATPTGMPWSEVYSALQTKVIDGAEAQHPAVYGARLYEVIKVITKTEHIYLITGIVTSRTWFDKLPADQQKVLLEETEAAGKWASEKTIESLADYEKKLREKGVSVVEIDKTPFRNGTGGRLRDAGLHGPSRRSEQGPRQVTHSRFVSSRGAQRRGIPGRQERAAGSADRVSSRGTRRREVRSGH